MTAAGAGVQPSASTIEIEMKSFGARLRRPGRPGCCSWAPDSRSLLAPGGHQCRAGYLLPIAVGRCRAVSLGDAEAENEVADVQVQQAAAD